MVKPNGIINVPDLNYIIIKVEDQICYYPGLGTQKRVANDKLTLGFYGGRGEGQ